MSTMAAAPNRSLEQRLEALRNANEIRSRRAHFKRDIKAGRATVDDVIDQIAEPAWWIETMKVADLLIAIPKWGRVKVNNALVQCRVAGSKTIGGLSVRQRDEIVDAVHRRAIRP